MADPKPASGAVPADARLVLAFVNTVEWQRDADVWRTPADLAGWLSAELGPPVPDLGAADLRRARAVREGLRALLLGNAGHDVLPSAVRELDRALGAVPLRMRVGQDGGLGLVPSGGSFGRALGRVAVAADAVRTAGDWPRLKACSRDSCRWAYWDGSRNGSARWCSMTGCGNTVKMRRRNRPGSPSGDVVPPAGDRPRPATMVDVAGLAGVSVKTVSNVVTGSVPVAPATRRRVLDAVDELAYTPNLAARALRTGA